MNSTKINLEFYLLFQTNVSNQSTCLGFSKCCNCYISHTNKPKYTILLSYNLAWLWQPQFLVQAIWAGMRFCSTDQMLLQHQMNSKGKWYDIFSKLPQYTMIIGWRKLWKSKKQFIIIRCTILYRGVKNLPD